MRTVVGPRYNGSSYVETIKAGQNCEAHRRPDTGYTYEWWRSCRCVFSPFDPAAFLRTVHGRHVTFMGDLLVRN